MYYAIEHQYKNSGLFSRWHTKATLFLGTLEDCLNMYNKAVVGTFTNNNYNRIVIVKHKIR